MKPGDECGFCETLLYAHCVELRHGREFCEVRQRYYSDPDMGTEDVYRALDALASPQQRLEGIRAVNTRRVMGLGPPPRT